MKKLICILLVFLCCFSTLFGASAEGEGAITLNETEIEIAKGKTLKLKATIASGSKKKLTWTSSDPSVAKVSQGTVTAKNPGTAVITATAADGASATCTVEVYAPVKSVSLDQKTATAFVDGSPIELKATVSPDNAKYRELTWTSSDESVATVDENGVVTPIKGGKTTITATANDKIGAKGKQQKASCVVSVDEAVKRVTISGGNQTIAKGKTAKLSAEVGPDSASNKKLVWSSSDESVAKVSQGKVTAKKTGTAVITATAADGSGVSASVTVTVIQGVTSVKMKSKTLVLFAGQTRKASASVSPSDATVKKLNWSSDASSVATVDENGTISAKRKGIATIKASATDGSGKSASMKVYVEPAVPLTIEGLGTGVFIANMLGLTVKNQCQKTAIVNFDFDLKMTSYYGTSYSGSYNLGKDTSIGAGKQKKIKRTLSGVGSAYQFTITITGVYLKDGTHYTIPTNLQQTKSFSMR